MSRFREEVYAAKWYQTLKKKASREGFGARLARSAEAAEREKAVRWQHLRQSHRGSRKGATAPQERLI